MRFSYVSCSLAAVITIGSSAAVAETLPVAGIYAAGSDRASSVQTIAVENFGGDEGASLSFAITDRLENVVIDGERYFEIYPTSGDDVDAMLRGTANAEVTWTELDDRKVTKCEKRDKDKKCIRERVTFYECEEIAVTLYPRVRLIANDGTELYTSRDQQSAADSGCANDSSRPSAQGMLDGLVSGFANQIRNDFAPKYRREDIRILESRKGMKGADKKAFRAAVKLTKTDIAASCEGFEAMEAAHPGHVSVLFNIGLCAEGRRELDTAEGYYQRALEAEPGKDYPTWGLTRIASKRRAADQLDAHYGPASEEPSAAL